MAHGAKQLAALCVYWMASDLATSQSNEQWREVGVEAKALVMAEHKRLMDARAAQQEERRLIASLPCLLAPNTGQPVLLLVRKN